MTLDELKPADLAKLTHGEVLYLLMAAMPDLLALQIPALMQAGKDLGPSWKTDVHLRRTCSGGEKERENWWEAQVRDVWGHMHSREYSSSEPDDALRRAVLDTWCMVHKYHDPGWVFIDNDGCERETQ